MLIPEVKPFDQNAGQIWSVVNRVWLGIGFIHGINICDNGLFRSLSSVVNTVIIGSVYLFLDNLRDDILNSIKLIRFCFS